MNKKIRLRPYSFQFLTHVRKFILSVDSAAFDKKIFVGLSGGIDSVALAHCCFLFWKYGQLKKRPEFIHVNHGTREQCHQEAAFLQAWSLSMGIKIHVINLQMSAKSADFENQARIKRYKAFQSVTSTPVLLGHHLDDSFEWSMMQKLKSSHARKSLGIPVLTNRAFRPFMCLSKEHLIRFSKEQGLKWFEDQTNRDLSFERNYIRDFIQKSIKDKYPKYLKHYVNQSNELARMYKLSVFKHVASKYRVLKREWGLVVQVDGLFIDDGIKELVLSQSSIKRGIVSSQIQKLKNGFKNKKKGPYSFSGGVKVFCFGSLILIVKKNNKPYISKVASQIPEGLPFLSKASKSKIKQSTSPFQVQMDELMDRGILFDYSWRSANSKVLYWL